VEAKIDCAPRTRDTPITRYRKAQTITISALGAD
jgi:hypothetical protein